MKKTVKKIGAILMTLIMAVQVFPITAYAAPLSGEEVICTFTNEDVLHAAQVAYEKGYISEAEMSTVRSIFSARFGVNGENKVVLVSSGSYWYIYDYYLNSFVWAMVVALGGVAVAPLLTLIPGLSEGAATVIANLVGTAGATILGTDKGVIIRIRMVDTSLGIGAPQYTNEFVSIREQ